MSEEFNESMRQLSTDMLVDIYESSEFEGRFLLESEAESVAHILAARLGEFAGIVMCPDHTDVELVPMLTFEGLLLREYDLEVWTCPVDGKWYWRDEKGKIKKTNRSSIIRKIRVAVPKPALPEEVPVEEVTFRDLWSMSSKELRMVAENIEVPTDELAQFFYNRDVWNPVWGAPVAYGIDAYYISNRGKDSYLKVVEEYGEDVTNKKVMYINGIWHKTWGDARDYKLPPVPKHAARTNEIYVW